MRGALSIFTPLAPLMQGPLGILGPVLLILLGLWMGRGDRSPWYVKGLLLALLGALVLVLFGYL